MGLYREIGDEAGEECKEQHAKDSGLYFKKTEAFCRIWLNFRDRFGEAQCWRKGD